jgi:hypothetical protein
MDLLWMKYFSRNSGEENVATSIDTDVNGDVYVTGYCYTPTEGYDFATIKYNGYTGEYAWQNKPVLFYNLENGNDKGSSVKVFGDSVYVSGPSQLYPGGYRTLAYLQNDGDINLVWDNVFIPSFWDIRNNVHRASVLNIDKSTGNVIVMTMAWDNYIINKYAIRGYSGNGSTLFTIDYGESTDNFLERNSSGSLQNNIKYELSQNYPNPFNPTTNLEFGISNFGFVTLKVYDMLGKEVAELVNDNLSPGIHKVNFDGSNLSSGIYYYKLTAEGRVIDTKRMLLVK